MKKAQIYLCYFQPITRLGSKIWIKQFRHQTDLLVNKAPQKRNCRLNALSRSKCWSSRSNKLIRWALSISIFNNIVVYQHRQPNPLCQSADKWSTSRNKFLPAEYLCEEEEQTDGQDRTGASISEQVVIYLPCKHLTFITEKKSDRRMRSSQLQNDPTNGRPKFTGSVGGGEMQNPKAQKSWSLCKVRPSRRWLRPTASTEVGNVVRIEVSSWNLLIRCCSGRRPSKACWPWEAQGEPGKRDHFFISSRQDGYCSGAVSTPACSCSVSPQLPPQGWTSCLQLYLVVVIIISINDHDHYETIDVIFVFPQWQLQW